MTEVLRFDHSRHYSCLPATSRLEPGLQQASLDQDNGLPISLPPTPQASESHDSCLCVACCSHQSQTSSLLCTRTHSLASCRSKCFSSSRTTTISLLMKQLRLLSFLTLLSLSLLSQIDLTVAAPLLDEPVLPDRCFLSFSQYDCGGFKETRYTYRNGSCRMAIEWIGPGCEYDGTENSFPSKEECEEVCIPDAPTTAPDNVHSPLPFPPMNDGGSSILTTTSQSDETAGGDSLDPTTSSSTSAVDTSICLQPLGDVGCSSFSFPTTYYYYDVTMRACQPLVSFCPINLPGVFDIRDECFNTCEGPLNPPPTTTPPTMTTSSQPAMTTLSQTGPATTHEEDGGTTSSKEPVSMTTQQTTTTASPVPATTTITMATDKISMKTTERTFVGTGSGQDGIPWMLNRFDVASLALGLMALVLIFVLVGVVSLSLYKRHSRLRRQKQEVMDSKKTEVRALAFTTNRQEKHIQTNNNSNTSMSTTSSTFSSYLTTV